MAVKSIIPQKDYKEWHKVLVTLDYVLQLVFRKTIRIGDTKIHI